MRTEKMSKMSFGSLCKRSSLFSALYSHKESLQLSHKRGNKVIFHIALGGISSDAIIRSGQLPHGVRFVKTDHIGVFLDLDSCPSLESIIEELSTSRIRKIVSKNCCSVNTYIK